ncbi:Heat shock factor 2-binding protein [Galemys pyrenaicus]|uniref:Heat shock factor 2-binding protein n=1 Tax=Galemys pyrenaicus TaxID=202257 RepID=A0A8J5ZTJ2_GALPY|nr:Heat shock factor 2-binding protein [Galemys pyrenaicus]
MEANLEGKEQELEQLRMDCEHLKARLASAQADSVRERKEKLALRQRLSEAKQQLLQQAEYCTEMGAAACTLLWGASSSEDAVKAILGGDKALKFFSITGQTMESFVKSLDGDVKELDCDENQFVFALAGIVTNVAAIACGREFLVTYGRVLLDTILQLLGDLKPGQCTKLKVYGGGVGKAGGGSPGTHVESRGPGLPRGPGHGSVRVRSRQAHWLTRRVPSCACGGGGGVATRSLAGAVRLMLMSLYNVSINLKGLKYISESPGFIPLLWWLLSDPDAEVCLHVLRLVQSLVLEPEVSSRSAPELRGSLPLQRILAMAKSRNPHLQAVARELLEDLRAPERDL